MNEYVRKLYKYRGFSLVELMIVIFFIAALAAMALLSLSSGTEERAEAMKTLNLLREYRSAAIAYMADHGTVFDSNLLDIGKSLDVYRRGYDYTQSKDSAQNSDLDSCDGPFGESAIDVRRMNNGNVIIGIAGKDQSALKKDLVRKILADSDVLYDANGDRFTGAGNQYGVYMILRKGN